MLGTLAYPVALHFQKKRHLANLVGPLDPQFALGFLSKCLPIIFVSFATLSVYGVMTWAANLQVHTCPFDRVCVRANVPTALAGWASKLPIPVGRGCPYQRAAQRP